MNLDKYTVYSDLPGHEAPGGGTIPPQMCVTQLKPDLVIVEKATQQIHIFELTCPREAHLDTWNEKKTNKYAHFLIDIPQSKLTAFEISSKGYLSPRNHASLKILHTYMDTSIKLSTFKANLASLSLMASHQIFINRNDPQLVAPPFLQS